MPISSISSASGAVIAERAIATLSDPKKMEQTAASPAVTATKRISVADNTTAKNPTAQAVTVNQSRKADSEAPPAAAPGTTGGRLDVMA